MIPAYQQQLLKALIRHAPEYQRVSAIPAEIGKRLLSRLIYLRRAPTHILDLGCGQGIDTQLLSEAYPSAEIIASDFCFEQFHYWSQNVLAHQSNIAFCVAEACALPFPTGSFDLIFANLLLPAILDYQTFWRECIRVLRPGGILLFSTLGTDTLKELKKSLAECGEAECMNIFPTLHDLGDGLTATGFSDPAIERESIELHYSSLKKLLTELKILGSIKLWTDYPHLYKSQSFWQALERYYYEHFRSVAQKLIATIEIYYAIAFAPQQFKEDMDSISIPLSSIKRKI